MLHNHHPEFLVSTPEENAHLESLEPTYLQYSEMTTADRQFLNSIVLRHKPMKVLEVGTSAGASAVIMLNAMRQSPSAKLYTIDLMKNYYYDASKDSGFVIGQYDDLARQCERYSGGLALKFLDEIGGDIDLVLIDTAHQNPGEILDTLMVLPYLAHDAIIVYHDVNLHAVRNRMGVNFRKSYTNNLLMSAVWGNKIVQGDWQWSNSVRVPFPNIGAVRTEPATVEHIWELMNLLTIQWSYIPSKDDEAEIHAFIKSHYSPYFSDYLAFVFSYQRSIVGLDLVDKAKRHLKKLVGPKRIRAIVGLMHRKETT